MTIQSMNCNAGRPSNPARLCLYVLHRHSPLSVAAFAALILVLASAPARAAAPNGRPNIVVIVSDDQGYNDLGCYGSKEIKTPNLDRLATQGVRLTEFYVTWPACTPSRAGLLTGRYPQRNGTYDMFRNYLVDVGHSYTPAEYAVSPENILGTDVREVLLSNILKWHGYTNACFGKWDMGQLRRFLPLQRGFHEYYGLTNTGIDYFTHERYDVPSMRRGNDITTADKGTYCTDLFRREAVRFIKENHSKPFFLYLPFNAPHGASSLSKDVRGWVQATPEYIAQYPKGKTVRAEKRRHYMAAVTCMDDAIGEVLDLLDEYKIADNTIVIFFSDNGGGGGADNTPLRGRKGQMFEGGIRVPCILRWPRRIQANTVSNKFLTSLEILPTLIDSIGGERLEDVKIDGYSLLPVLMDNAPSPRMEMFWERREDHAARVGKWKWVESARGNGLFDLSNDVGERHDLSESHPEVLNRVKARFAAWKKEMDEAEPRRPFRDF